MWLIFWEVFSSQYLFWENFKNMRNSLQSIDVLSRGLRHICDFGWWRALCCRGFLAVCIFSRTKLLFGLTSVDDRGRQMAEFYLLLIGFYSLCCLCLGFLSFSAVEKYTNYESMEMRGRGIRLPRFRIFYQHDKVLESSSHLYLCPSQKHSIQIQKITRISSSIVHRICFYASVLYLLPTSLFLIKYKKKSFPHFAKKFVWKFVSKWNKKLICL